ncbi:MAG: SdrD B-like domain-containing protein, partial [Pirellulaceae bacterium]
MNWITRWNRRRRSLLRRRCTETQRNGNRICRIESMEQRRMLHADALLIGAVYTENDMGNDVQGDTFEVSFVGGAAGSQLTRIVIDGDQIENYQNPPGLSSGDVFFDTLPGSRGVDNALPFTLHSVTDAQGNTKHGVVATETVTDGGLELIVDLTGIVAGDILTFSIDVDEAENVDPRLSATEQNLLFDPLTSGAEFHGSILTAYFSAPRFHDVEVKGMFVNFYDSLAESEATAVGETVVLPSDGERGTPDRTSGSFAHVEQTPLPVTIAGTVYHDRNRDLIQDTGNGELGIEGVNIELWTHDANGQFIAVTTASGNVVVTQTDSQGDYSFDASWNLGPGTYEVREQQPAEYEVSVGAIPGTIEGALFGSAKGTNTLTGVSLLGGQNAIDYDFAEANFASISGSVYHDRNNDGVRDVVGGEEGIADVTMSLLDQTGLVTAVTTTDSLGFYAFNDLRRGTYTVLETQPNGWIDGIDTPGLIGGVQVGMTTDQDDLRGIDLTSDSHGTEYNFGEFLGASIAGQIHTDVNNNCVFEPLAEFAQTQQREIAILGVTVELYDTSGKLIATTTTDVLGNYRFDGLLPGEYSVVEIQPSDLFSVGEKVGSGSGQVVVDNEIAGIQVSSGTHLADYNFCEAPPASLSGIVFQDGSRIRTADGGPPNDLAKIRDGVLTPDDTRLSGVILELRDGLNGQPIDASLALPGYYADGPIRTQTDADGEYNFLGLAAGNYAVYEIQPTGYFDSFDTAGTTSGRTLNANQPMPANIINFAANPPPPSDAILGIPLGYGQISEQNNFSEVRTFAVVLPPQPPVPPKPPRPPRHERPPHVEKHMPHHPVSPVPFQIPFYRGSGRVDVSWHLSIVDAGAARGSGTDTSTIWVREGTKEHWQVNRLKTGQWIMPAVDEHLEQLTFEHLFGHQNAIPVTGDFDGNGITEIGVYIQGQWFLDLNGNGRWDES